MTIIPLLLMLLAPPQIFESTGVYAIDSTPDAAMASRSQPQTSGGDKPAASGVRLSDRYVVVFTSSGCSPCNRMKQTTIPALKAAGVPVRVIDVNSSEYESHWSVSLVPSTWIVDRVTRKRVGSPVVGFVNAETVLSRVGVVQRTVTTQRERLPVVQTQWGTIDLETYNRPGCNCPMCQGIRSLQRSYRQSQTIETPKSATPPSQEPTPDAMIDRMLDLMRLRESDVLADLGCGDGRILIEATKRYGCRGVGVEIDRTVANRARAAVRDAGMDEQITIVTGDALDFDPSEYGVTAVSVFLYPELLEKLSPKLKRSRVVASPFHAVPGLAMTEHDGIFVYRDGR